MDISLGGHHSTPHSESLTDGEGEGGCIELKEEHKLMIIAQGTMTLLLQGLLMATEGPAVRWDQTTKGLLCVIVALPCRQQVGHWLFMSSERAS